MSNNIEIEKHKKVVSIDKRIKRLTKLIVARSVEKSDKYDNEINALESQIEYFYYGIKI